MSDYIARVALGSGLVGLLSGMMGTFAVLRRESLIGDAVSHSSLPGIVIAFMLIGVKSGPVLLAGAVASGVLALFTILAVSSYTKLKFDTAIAVTLSSFFGLGMVLLGAVQKQMNANQAGLNSYIFGQAAAFLKRDLTELAAVTALSALVIALMYKEFKLFSFDADYARSIGYNTKFIGLVLSLLTVINIVFGLKTVGVILMSAMLIAPASAARQWSDRFCAVLLAAPAFGFISGIAGTYISVKYSLPTGPSITMVMMAIVLVSFTLAPKRGLIYKMSEKKKNKKRIDTLMVLYLADHLMHTGRDCSLNAISKMVNEKRLSLEQVQSIVENSFSEGLLSGDVKNLKLTDSGHETLRKEGLLWTHMYK